VGAKLISISLGDGGAMISDPETASVGIRGLLRAIQEYAAVRS
jgi:hypothetical protein